MKKIFTLIIIFIIYINAYSQNKIEGNENGKLQFGLSVKLNIEFSYKYHPNFKLSATTGVGYDIEQINFFPTFHAGFILFNTGMVGSNLQKDNFSLGSNFFFSTIGTLKLDKRDWGYTERYVPFYHFADFTANPLQNPYKTSVSYGAIWVTMPNGKFQRLGLINLNVIGRFQLTYYNDGGPILKIAGDKHDRYYSGGIVFSGHLDNYYNMINNDYLRPNLIELSFHKYTGYTPYAFDIADKMDFDFLLYADKEQMAYNNQRWKLSVSNVIHNYGNYGAYISLYNLNTKDVQDWLHFKGNNPYHPPYNKGWRPMVGGTYSYNYLKVSE